MLLAPPDVKRGHQQSVLGAVEITPVIREATKWGLSARNPLGENSHLPSQGLVHGGNQHRQLGGIDGCRLTASGDNPARQLRKIGTGKEVWGHGASR